MFRAVVLAVVAMVVSTTAAADPRIIAVEVATGERPNRDAPVIVVSVDGGSSIPATAWTLTDEDDPARTVVAAATRRHADDPEPIAVVVVLQGHELFFVDPSDGCLSTPKISNAVRRSIGLLATRLGSPGSFGGVVVYHQGADVKHPMGPLSAMAGHVLGADRDYEGMITRDLVAGVKVARDELAKVDATRKAMIVIGDGADTNVDEAKPELRRLRDELQNAGVELYAIGYDASIGEFGTAIGTLVPDYRVVQSVEGIDDAMGEVIDRIEDRIAIAFSGRTLQCGSERGFILRAGGWTVDTLYLGLPEGCRPPPAAPVGWWWIAATGVATFVSTLGLIVFVARRRAERRRTMIP